MISMDLEQASMETAKPSLSDSLKQDFHELSGELWGKKGYLAKAAFLTAFFAALEFAYQYLFVTPGDADFSAIRGFAFAGATLIGVAVSLGPLANFKQAWNFVEYRRTFGVAGFLLACVHVSLVMAKIFNFNLGAAYYSLNPFQNPIIFGSLALSIFFLLFLTSTDWAIGKLGFRNWKSLHRLIYFAYIFSVLHFIQINPPAIQNLGGYLLLAVTFVGMAFQLAGYAKKVTSGKAGLGTYFGAGITLLALALFAIAFFFKRAVGA